MSNKTELVFQDDYASFYCGNALDVLDKPPGEVFAVQSIITSPPYWGMRTYGGGDMYWPGYESFTENCIHQWEVNTPPFTKNCTRGQDDNRINAKAHKEGQGITSYRCINCNAYRGPLGHEHEPADYIAHLSMVIHMCRRHMLPDATLWLNIDDTYVVNSSYDTPKGSLARIPQRLAVELPHHYDMLLRCDIIWDKPNAMPEGPVRRPTRSHEYIQMYSMNEKYKYKNILGDAMSDSTRQTEPGLRNSRSVWSFNHTGDKMHNAVFPEELVKRCIVASTDEGDTVMDVFGGSGTVSYIAKMCNRKSIYIDCNQHYVDYAVKRYLTLPARLLL